ncbi:MAG: hypothetical protein JWL62_3083, partial [Hyphomicrobiales bacterium]|nr:hypothetical protein [Hyphomicrobiales bacterium]
MKNSCVTQLQASLDAQSRDSFKLLLLQKKIADDVAKGDGKALEKDIADLSATYKDAVSQDATLRNSNLDGKLVDQIEKDQYALGQDYKSLEQEARQAIKNKITTLKPANSAKLADDLTKMNADVSKLANGSAGGNAAFAAATKLQDDLQRIQDVQVQLMNEKVPSKLPQERSVLRALFDDLTKQAASVAGLGYDATAINDNIKVMKPSIDKLVSGAQNALGYEDAKQITEGTQGILDVTSGMLTNIAGRKSALTAQSADLARVASLLKTISEDLKSGNSQKVATDKLAIGIACGDLQIQNSQLTAFGADPALVAYMDGEIVKIRQGLKAINSAA